MKKIFTILAIAVVLVSCGSSRKIQTDSITTPKASQTQVQNVVAKLDVNLKSGTMDMDVDGKVQVRRDQMMRVLITPFGLMEAARLEITPNDILIVDRINKQYVRARYDEVPELKNNGITFQTLQDRFYEEYPKKTFTISIDKMTLHMTLNKISNDDSWDATPYSVPSKYKQTSVKEALSQLKN